MISFNDMDYYENHFVLCALKIILCFVVLCCAKALFKNEMNYLPCCLLFICSICFSNFSTSPLSPFIFALPLAKIKSCNGDAFFFVFLLVSLRSTSFIFPIYYIDLQFFFNC